MFTITAISKTAARLPRSLDSPGRGVPFADRSLTSRAQIPIGTALAAVHRILATS
jgi:hypothetical protein